MKFSRGQVTGAILILTIVLAVILLRAFLL